MGAIGLRNSFSKVAYPVAYIALPIRLVNRLLTLHPFTVILLGYNFSACILPDLSTLVTLFYWIS